ncbi:FlgD immunoglobulin-like domain containing protein, partial [Actinokineospora sp.]|uniref:FlgD immunoglobulin-like domain containing protein n=1 Tax=Actinokineospora sp. TaxID=1872133 RepID=UPI003D6A2338
VGATSDLYGQHVDAAGQVSDPCTGTAALGADTPVAATGTQNYYTFEQTDFYWCGVGVRGAAGSDWDLETYLPVTFGSSRYPSCFSGPLAGSFAIGGVDFVVADFNIGHTLPVSPGGGYGVRAFRYAGTGQGTVEWDTGADWITKDCGTGGNCGARSGNNWSGMLDVWDVYLFGNQTYTFDFTRTGSADIHLLLFGSTGTTGTFFAPRSGRLFETTDASHVFTAPDTGWYGVALVNDNGLTGTYTVRVNTTPLTGVGDPPVAETGLRAVVPNPSAGPMQFRFTLREPAAAGFDVLDMAGRLVARIPEQRHEAGTWSAGWEGRTSTGRRAPPGVYFVQMRVDGRRTGLARLALIR